MTIAGAGQLAGTLLPAGPVGPAAWLPVTAWAPSSNYSVGPPASVVTYAGDTYVCTNSHVSGLTFNLAMWTLIAASGAPGLGGMTYRGPWNAATNFPYLVSGVGNLGDYYKVSAAGSTILDNNSTWEINDLLVFDGAQWDKFEGPSQTFSQLTVSPAGRVLPTPIAGSIVQAGGPDGAGGRVEIDVFGATAHFSGVRYDGTLVAPTALLSGDMIVSFDALGYTGVGAAAAGSFKCYAAENWSSGHQGSYWRASVTAIGSISRVDVLSIENDGGVCLPPTVTGGTKGAGTLNLNALYIAGILQTILSAPATLTNAANDAAAAAAGVAIGTLYRNGSVIMVRIV